MIRAVFFESESGRGFEITGHAGGNAGSDIVCAAVSSAVYMAANTVTDVINVHAGISEQDGHFRFSVTPTKLSNDIFRRIFAAKTPYI